MPATAPSPLVRLDDDIPTRLVGNKFARLATARHRATVPDARCIPVDWFTHALGATRLRQIRELCADLEATLGNHAAQLEPALAAILDGLTMTTPMRTHLAAEMTELADSEPGASFAVRSSSTVEDGARHSHAGLYESHLHVRGQHHIEQAVLSCWRSFYSARAILGRVRAGQHDAEPAMAVIVQRMVRPRLAGVAFTQHDRTVIDSTTGTADHLVAGLTEAHHTQVERGAAAPVPYHDVARLAENLRGDCGHDVDIEWACDDESRVCLLQVRPVTAALQLAASTEPVFASASLYVDDTLPPDLHVGDCADVYYSYTTKRAPLYRLAHTHGISTGRGWIIALNASGLAESRAHPTWWATLGETVVLDLGPSLRQHILPTTQLPGFLASALNLTGDPTRVHPLILREFTQGQAGIITSRSSNGATIMEYAAQGLLAMNRGLTQPARQLLPPLRDAAAWRRITPPEGWSAGALRELAEFTAVLDEQIPHVHAEWVLHNGQPQFIDVSIPNHTQTATRSTGAADSGTTVIAGGTAHGPLLRLDDNQELTKLSVAPIISVNFRADAPHSPYIASLIEHIQALPTKPILHAHRPYAILSLLIDHAAGFVFQGGSTLCHLAILLREAHLPALIAPTLQLQNHHHEATITNDTIRLG